MILQLLAQAYGEGAYSCAEYNEGCTTQEGTPTSPDTGAFLQQPAYVWIGLGLFIIIFFVALARLIVTSKKRKQN